MEKSGKTGDIDQILVVALVVTEVDHTAVVDQDLEAGGFLIEGQGLGGDENHAVGPVHVQGPRGEGHTPEVLHPDPAHHPGHTGIPCNIGFFPVG